MTIEEEEAGAEGGREEEEEEDEGGGEDIEEWLNMISQRSRNRSRSRPSSVLFTGNKATLAVRSSLLLHWTCMALHNIRNGGTTKTTTTSSSSSSISSYESCSCNGEETREEKRGDGKTFSGNRGVNQQDSYRQVGASSSANSSSHPRALFISHDKRALAPSLPVFEGLSVKDNMRQGGKRKRNREYASASPSAFGTDIGSSCYERNELLESIDVKYVRTLEDLKLLLANLHLLGHADTSEGGKLKSKSLARSNSASYSYSILVIDGLDEICRVTPQAIEKARNVALVRAVERGGTTSDSSSHSSEPRTATTTTAAATTTSASAVVVPRYDLKKDNEGGTGPNHDNNVSVENKKVVAEEEEEEEEDVISIAANQTKQADRVSQHAQVIALAINALNALSMPQSESSGLWSGYQHHPKFAVSLTMNQEPNASGNDMYPSTSLLSKWFSGRLHTSHMNDSTFETQLVHHSSRLAGCESSDTRRCRKSIRIEQSSLGKVKASLQ